jgi:hypothetical protein
MNKRVNRREALKAAVGGVLWAALPGGAVHAAAQAQGPAKHILRTLSQNLECEDVEGW